MSSKENLQEVMETAIQMEKDGIKYYSSAAEKIDNDPARKMFNFLIEDEKRHIEKWKAVSREEDIKDSGEKKSEELQRKIKTIFSSIPADIKEKIKASSREAQVLSGAIEMEEKGIKYYTEKASELEGRAAELCRLIAREEKTHRDLLRNTLEYIQNNWHWNVETEEWFFT